MKHGRPLKETPGRSQVSLTPSGGLTRSGRSGGALKETPGRSQVSLTPSGGLTRSGRSGGALKETPGRSQVSLTPSGGLTRSGRSGGPHRRDLGRAIRVALLASTLLIAIGLAASALLVATALFALRAAPGEWSVRAPIVAIDVRLSVVALMRFATHPLGIRLLDGRAFATRWGTLHADAGPMPSSLVVRCEPCIVAARELAAEPLRIASIEVRFEHGEPNELHGSVRAGRVHATWAAQLEARGLDVDIDVLDAPVADFVALFGAAIPEVDRAWIDGRAGAHIRVALPSGWTTVEPRLAGLAVAGLGTESLIAASPRPACARPPPGRRTAAPFGTWLPRAVIAAEDQRFHEHAGYDVAEMTAAWAGDASGHHRGASTISQQLAKLLYTGDERTVARKLRELLYAAELDRTLGKARVLQLYLGVAPWGDGQCGGEAAALHYFGKHAAALSAAEAVWLAHLLRNPVAMLDADASGSPSTARRLDVVGDGLLPMRRSQREAMRRALQAWVPPPVVQARRLPLRANALAVSMR